MSTLISIGAMILLGVWVAGALLFLLSYRLGDRTLES